MNADPKLKPDIAALKKRLSEDPGFAAQVTGEQAAMRPELALFFRDLRNYLLHVIDMGKGEHYLDVVRLNAQALIRRMEILAAAQVTSDRPLTPGCRTPEGCSENGCLGWCDEHKPEVATRCEGCAELRDQLRDLMRQSKAAQIDAENLREVLHRMLEAPTTQISAGWKDAIRQAMSAAVPDSKTPNVGVQRRPATQLRHPQDGPGPSAATTGSASSSPEAP